MLTGDNTATAAGDRRPGRHRARAGRGAARAEGRTVAGSAAAGPRRRHGRRRHQRRAGPRRRPTSASPSAPAPTSRWPPPTSPWSAATCAASSPRSRCRAGPSPPSSRVCSGRSPTTSLLIPVAAGALYLVARRPARPGPGRRGHGHEHGQRASPTRCGCARFRRPATAAAILHPPLAPASASTPTSSGIAVVALAIGAGLTVAQPHDTAGHGMNGAARLAPGHRHADAPVDERDDDHRRAARRRRRGRDRGPPRPTRRRPAWRADPVTRHHHGRRGPARRSTDLTRSHEAWMHLIATRADLGTLRPRPPRAHRPPRPARRGHDLPDGGQLHHQHRVPPRRARWPTSTTGRPSPSGHGAARGPARPQPAQHRSSTGCASELHGDADAGRTSDLTLHLRRRRHRHGRSTTCSPTSPRPDTSSSCGAGADDLRPPARRRRGRRRAAGVRAARPAVRPGTALPVPLRPARPVPVVGPVRERRRPGRHRPVHGQRPLARPSTFLGPNGPGHSWPRTRGCRRPDEPAGEPAGITGRRQPSARLPPARRGAASATRRRACGRRSRGASRPSAG